MHTSTVCFWNSLQTTESVQYIVKKKNVHFVLMLFSSKRLSTVKYEKRAANIFLGKHNSARKNISHIGISKRNTKQHSVPISSH